MKEEAFMHLIKNSRFSMLARCAYSNLSSIKINAKIKEDSDLLFIWIPKAAGTTIFSALEDTTGMQKRKKPTSFLSFPQKGAVTFGHVSYLSLLGIGAVSKRFHNSAYKFTVVRNPYERAVSLFNYFKQHGRIEQTVGFNSFLDAVALDRPPIGLYNVCGISQANPQADWVTAGGGGAAR